MTDAKHYLYLLLAMIFLIAFLITLILLFYYKSILIDPKYCPKCNNDRRCARCNNTNSTN